MTKRNFNWFYHFNTQEKAGVSAAEYCRMHKIDIKAWHYQKKKIKQCSPFVEMKMDESPSETQFRRLEVFISDQGEFKMSGNIEVMAEVAKLWRALA